MANQTKKRVFLANDASYLDTGYGIYGKELLTRLHNSDKYEVAELGCYATVEVAEKHNIPWKFYANAVSPSDKRIDLYKGSILNQFGLWRFNRALLDFKPHIVFDIRDYWMFAYQETSPLKKYFNWVVMPATDSGPPKIDWLHTYSNADIIVPYTRWAYTTLQKYGGKHLNIFPKFANAGINPHEFYILENKAELKKQYFGIDNASVTGLVMRNQKRKLISDIMLAYKNYLEALKSSNQMDLYNRSLLYLHTSYPEENGWDIPSLLLEFGLADKTYFSYKCNGCKKFFPSKFQGSFTICPYCQKRGGNFVSASNGVPTETLNTIYNLFDIFIQYAICEGFGMPQIEAAACGLQIASVDYSAMTEVCENLYGVKIPVKRLFRELETNADRAYPDNDITSSILYQFFVKTPDAIKQNNSIKIREACVNQYTWDNVFKVWDECFDTIDINSKISWDDPNYGETDYQNTKVPGNLSNEEFVDYICRYVIKDPELVNTANVQTIMRDLDMAIVCRNQTSTLFNRPKAVENLESLLSNKVAVEQMRKNSKLLPTEDFI